MQSKEPCISTRFASDTFKKLEPGEDKCVVGNNGHKACGAIVVLDPAADLISLGSVYIGKCTAKDFFALSGATLFHSIPVDEQALRTRLAGLTARQQEALINWGYLMADVSVHSYIDGTVPRIDRLPYGEPPLECK